MTSHSLSSTGNTWNSSSTIAVMQPWTLAAPQYFPDSAADQIAPFIGALFPQDAVTELRLLPSGKSFFYPANQISTQAVNLTLQNELGQRPNLFCRSSASDIQYFVFPLEI
jgi:hypothetical protein